jgi:23S rRNA (adenine2503-C2)-methyltransferase
MEDKIKKLRLKQLGHHYFERYTTDPREMSDIPDADAKELVNEFIGAPLGVIDTQIGDGGDTVKTLCKLQDSESIESVLMYYPDRATLCISCQVGCSVGCPFCATGTLGLKRNLTALEMVEQVRLSLGDASKRGAKLTNVVFMGMGEPTQNLDNIFSALDYICTPSSDHAKGGGAVFDARIVGNFGLSPRNITISTSGSIPGIRRIQDDLRPFRLAISLHAATNELRNELVPVNKRWSLEDVLDAGYEYYLHKKVRVSIEYALMRGVNDSEKDAFTLAKVLNRRGSGWVHVNLIPLNDVPGSPWTASSAEDTEIFIQTLKSKGVMVTLRSSRGQDIDGACGQLAITRGVTPRTPPLGE